MNCVLKVREFTCESKQLQMLNVSNYHKTISETALQIFLHRYMNIGFEVLHSSGYECCDLLGYSAM
jgi:hypothetical protein